MKRAFAACVVIALVAAAAWTYREIQRVEAPPAARPQHPPNADWLEQLYSQNPRDAAQAAQIVRQLGQDALPVIQATLRNEHAEAEQLKGALKACGILGRTASPIIDDVAELLSEPALTAEAAVALSYMGPEAFIPLRNALSSPDPIVRREALRSIGKLKERASLETRRVLPLLIERMKDPDESVRAVAATYLGIIHEGAHEVVPVLVAGLADSDPEVRVASASALGSFDPASARSALPALRRASRDRNPDVAREAALALVKLGKK